MSTVLPTLLRREPGWAVVIRLAPASSVVPVGDIQVYMGHNHVQTTQIYMHHAPKHNAAEKLTAAFAPEASGLSSALAG